MTEKQAEQIADLLHARNPGPDRISSTEIFNNKSNYPIVLSDTDEVIACAEIKQVQWYQWEILHVSVVKNAEGTGVAFEAASKAEQLAKENGALILQCTIREENIKSRNLCERNGFKEVNIFYNPDSKKNLIIYQKVFSPKN